MTKLSIVILNYNTKELTSSCIESVLKQYYSQIKDNEFELIVVDNASTDGSQSLLSRKKNIKVVKNSENYGFSKGCNIGAKKASGEYLLFLNSDTRVKDKGFLGMIDFLDKNLKIGVLGGKLLNKDNSQQASCGSFYNLLNVTVTLLGGERIGLVRRKPKKIEDFDWVSGAAMMVRRDLFEKLNGFDEKLFMYMEDIEFCFRAKRSGFKVFFYPDVKIIHQELGSSNRRFAVVNIYKGLSYFYKKHARLEYPLVWLLLFTKALIAIFIGIILNNNYLKKTYSGALKFAV